MENETTYATTSEMGIETIEVHFHYKTKEVAEMLGVEPATIRKYVRELESNGYLFDKSEGGHRSYSEYDVAVLRQLKQMIATSGMSVGNCVRIINNDETKRNRNGSVTGLENETQSNGKGITSVSEEEVIRIVQRELHTHDLVIKQLLEQVELQQIELQGLKKLLPAPVEEVQPPNEAHRNLVEEEMPIEFTQELDEKREKEEEQTLKKAEVNRLMAWFSWFGKRKRG